jgi:hypothetical protein
VDIARGGHWTLPPDTGHPDAWTLAEDADRVARHGRYPDILGRHPSGRPLDAGPCFPWTAPAALGSPGRLGGEAPASARDAYRGTGQLLGRSVGQATPRRTALLRTIRVERRARRRRSSVMAGAEVGGLVGAGGERLGAAFEQCAGVGWLFRLGVVYWGASGRGSAGVGPGRRRRCGSRCGRGSDVDFPPGGPDTVVMRHRRTAEVADILYVSPKTVTRWANECKLPFLRTGTAATRRPGSASWPISFAKRQRPERHGSPG